MAYVDQKSGSRHLPSVVGVVAVHTLIGYAFISGLAMNVIKQTIPVFIVDSIRDTPPPPPLPQPPTPQRPTHQERVTLPTPVIDTLTSSDQAIRVDPVVEKELPPEPFVRVDDPPLTPSKAVGPRVQGARARWITTEDYPSAAIRAEEEGTVGISVRIGSTGRVTACTVTASSGHSRLDAATCQLYPRRARFTPALDAAGNPVEASYADRVRWELPRQ